MAPTPRKRRIWLLVLLAVSLMLCADVAVVPVGWFAYETYIAGRGEADPEAAITVDVAGLSADEELGVSRVLPAKRRDELLDQWRAYRVEAERSDVPSKFEITEYVTEDQDSERATVTAYVQPIWWSQDGSGLSLHGTAHPWTFETRRDRRGWRIWRVDPSRLVRHRRTRRHLPLAPRKAGRGSPTAVAVKAPARRAGSTGGSV
ncbi:hypothetical protein [Micromonospora sp. CPCC 206061]|uniref:hypothetical protein n=1 Tax=Micromonospora sp. CPCC 206061 TaxID=3122410 RepID=UPI002FF12A68